MYSIFIISSVKISMTDYRDHYDIRSIIYIFIGDESECHEKENKNVSCGLKRKVHVDKNLFCLMKGWRP